MQRQSRQPPELQSCLRCRAKTRSGSPCRSPAVKGRQRCRMHGGAHGSGGPKGRANGRYKAGRFTTEAQQSRRELSTLLAVMRAGLKGIEG
ncbi:MAG: hypothetical protein E6R03_13620 [Hyphomicrobiaceae bacterium]|nr:MAG: hypothetical protein E6R03_13620 [Hyphomicrobiaceae bacterium]